MDFMIDFPMTKLRNNIIMVVVDRFFKMTYFMLLHFGEGKADIMIVIKFLFDYIFKFYRLLKEIISDRDPWFIFNIAC